MLGNTQSIPGSRAVGGNLESTVKKVTPPATETKTASVSTKIFEGVNTLFALLSPVFTFLASFFGFNKSVAAKVKKVSVKSALPDPAREPKARPSPATSETVSPRPVIIPESKPLEHLTKARPKITVTRKPPTRRKRG